MARIAPRGGAQTWEACGAWSDRGRGARSNGSRVRVPQVGCARMVVPILVTLLALALATWLVIWISPPPQWLRRGNERGWRQGRRLRRRWRRRERLEAKRLLSCRCSLALLAQSSSGVSRTCDDDS